MLVLGYQNLILSADGKFTTIVIQTQTYASTGESADLIEGFEDVETRSDKVRIDAQQRQYLTDKENSEAVTAARKIARAYDASDFQIYIAGSAAVTHFLKQSMMKDIRKFLIFKIIPQIGKAKGRIFKPAKIFFKERGFCLAPILNRIQSHIINPLGL